MWFANQAVAPPLSQGHHIARSSEDLARMVRAMRSVEERAFDFETNGLRYADASKHPIGYGLGFIGLDGIPQAWYVPVAHQTAEPMANPVQARRAFEDALEGAEALIGHHLKFDLNVARASGWKVPEDADIHDTLVQAYLCYEKRSFKLEDLVASTEGATRWDPFAMATVHDTFTQNRAKGRSLTWKKDKPGRGIRSYLSTYGHAEVPVALEGEYCCRDIAHTLLLDQCQRAEAMGMGQPWADRRYYLYLNEMLMVRALADMEYQGQYLDADYLRAYAAELDAELHQRAIKLAAAFGAHIDFGNDNQVRDLLYGHLKLPVVKFTDSGMPAVDRSALLQLAHHHPALADLGDYSLRNKVRSTYTHSLAFYQDSDSKVHMSVLQQGTKSGRFAARNPNLQNIPIRVPELAKRIRHAFYVPEGVTRVYVDYSQIELRILAWSTGNVNLLTAYDSPSYMALLQGSIDYDTYRVERQKEDRADVHALQAKSALGAAEADPDWKLRRKAAKIINFGVPYGMGWGGLASNPDLMLSESDAKAYFAQYHEGNPEIQDAKAALFAKMRREYGVPFFINWAGRKVHAPGLNSGDDEWRGKSERSTFASLIQGSAGELTRFSIVALWQARRAGKLPAVATSTVHDEIQLDCGRADERYVAFEAQRIMEDHFRGRFGTVPIIADLETTHTTWAEKEDYHG